MTDDLLARLQASVDKARLARKASALAEIYQRETDQTGETRHVSVASGPCTMGVGCDEYGVCYADAHGEPERCEETKVITDGPA